MEIQAGQTLTTVEFKDLTEKELERAAEAGLCFQAGLRNVERFTVYNPTEFLEALDQKGGWTGLYPVLGLSRDGTMLVMQSCFGWGKEDQIHCTAVKVVKG